MTTTVRVQLAFAKHDASRKIESLAAWIARRLPLGLRRAVIVDAAVRCTQPSQIGRDAYAGPDGLDYKRLYDGAALPLDR